MGYVPSFCKQGIWITEKLVAQDSPTYSRVEPVFWATEINDFMEERLPVLDLEHRGIIQQVDSLRENMAGRAEWSSLVSLRGTANI